MRYVKNIPIQLILFLFFFGVFALFINSNDIGSYFFLRNTVRAIVEQGHIYIDDYQGAVAEWADAFRFKGHIYQNK